MALPKTPGRFTHPLASLQAGEAKVLRELTEQLPARLLTEDETYVCPVLELVETYCR